MSQSLEERITQLEKIVATQSEMILKLVEMMNHLGAEDAALGERIEAGRTATANQLEKVAAAVQRLVGQFGGDERDN